MNLSIGELARRTGIKIPTIRYYEQVGLLPQPPRTEGGQRRYDEIDAFRLSFVRRARELGFGLDAIRELLALSTRPDQSCAEIDSIARRHIAAIDGRIAHLRSLRAELARVVGECDQGRVSECRVIEALGSAGHQAGSRAPRRRVQEHR
jgi:DNA-binding transcriptional MerR regulator